MTCVTNSGAQAYGGADDLNFTTTEQCVFTHPVPGGYHTYRNVAGGTDPNGVSVGNPPQQSIQPTQAVLPRSTCSRIPLRSTARFGRRFSASTTKDAATVPSPGLPYWNLDMSIRKNVKIWESTSLDVLRSHDQYPQPQRLRQPNLQPCEPLTGFGVINSQGNSPRSIEIGVRASF